MMQTKNKWLLKIILLSVVILSSALALLFTACDMTVTVPVDFKSFTLSYADGKAQLKWEVDGATEYAIYRGDTASGCNQKIGTTKEKNFTWADGTDYYKVIAYKNGKEVARSTPKSYARDAFDSKNVRVFAPRDGSVTINKAIDDLYQKMKNDEFGVTRTAQLFMPGNYSGVELKLGYYTSVNGLGATPESVTVDKLNVTSRTDTQNALINFWRTAENFSTRYNSTWSVSQATSLRRTHFQGDLLLCDVGASSGGFLADSIVNGLVNASSQQQWLTRNSWVGSWSHAFMNTVFAGTVGNIPQGNWTAENKNDRVRSTILDTVNQMREKPYLVFDKTQGYGVMIPTLRENSRDVSWREGQEHPATFIPLENFYIAHSDRDDATSINEALAEGKNLLFTPGIYALDKPIEITRKNTVVLGMGLATLTPTAENTDTCMRVFETDGVSVCSLLFDAGSYSKTLLDIEENTQDENTYQSALFADLFFRAGGATFENTKVDSCVILDADNVIGDNFWVWRADHGVNKSNPLTPGHDSIGWDKNRADNGITINGDNVIFYGLMVEHFQKYQTVWNGENGFTCFYQCETPYDALTQEDWQNGDGSSETHQGYASYKVGEHVTTHTAYALGIYYVNTIAVRKLLDHAVETPERAGIVFNHIVTKHFHEDKENYIRYAINGYGRADEDGEADFNTTVGLFTA